MSLRNTRDRYGWLAKLFHWTTATAFLTTYCVIYYALWFLGGKEHPRWVPTLNVHWMLGLFIGVLTISRFIWKRVSIQPDPPPGSWLEHKAAHIAHTLLYFVLIVMPLTGYLGTRRGTDFGLFFVPSFNDTALFEWISATWHITYAQFEKPLDVVHHIVGKWVGSAVVVLHIGAALYHHWIRRDATLTRMLPDRDASG